MPEFAKSAADRPDDSGLGREPRREWKTPAETDQLPIERLKPGSDLHQRVLDYLLERISVSERFMKRFYNRWAVSEKKIQAYIDLPQYEKILKNMNDAGKPASPVEITVPYSYATLSTIVTYEMQALAGRRPMFPVGSNSREGVAAAQKMELVLQYQAEHERLARKLFTYLQDGETYGLQVFRLAWTEEEAYRTVWRTQPGIDGTPERMRMRELRRVYEGCEIANVDPYMFFPDPRVPMCEVNRRGEWVFWRQFEGKHEVLSAEHDGVFSWTKYVGNMPRANEADGASSRDLLSMGDSHPGSRGSDLVRNTVQLDQGTVVLIPRELGLGSSERPEKWLFTIGNKNQIIQAEPFVGDHGYHPVAVGEPYTLGYGFGNPGVGDFLGPLQDVISWYVNSHILNVRTALNNMFVVDPSRIEMKDFKTPGPGRLLRLKPAAIGQDVRTIVQQLQVADVTQNHMGDLRGFTQFGDIMAAVGDNLRGQQTQGGRKSATESRQTFQAAGARLATHTQLIASQGVADLTEMMCMNTQQFMSEGFYVTVVGRGEESIWIEPEMLVGDFNYPIYDGTLPLDKVAMLDVWKEIFAVVLRDQQLRQIADVPEMFKFIAELGGAKNISNFLLNPQPDAMVAQQVQAGNVVPLGGRGPSPNVNAISEDVSDRLV